jgi:hypothetical protein
MTNTLSWMIETKLRQMKDALLRIHDAVMIGPSGPVDLVYVNDQLRHIENAIANIKHLTNVEALRREKTAPEDWEPKEGD